MAGSDMSKNLGGMLSGAAGALGTMGSSYSDSLVRNIENTTRPDIDPTDIASQQGLMQWQNNMGRTKEAAITQSNVQQLQATKLLEAEKGKETRKAEGEARIAQLKQAMNGIVASPAAETPGGQTALNNLQSAITSEALAAGLSPTDYQDTLTKAWSTALDHENKALQIESQQRTALEEKQLEALSVALSSTDLTTEAGQKSALKAGAKYESVVRDAIKAAQTIKADNMKAAEEAGKLTLPVSKDSIDLMLSAFADDSQEAQALKSLADRVDAWNADLENPSAKKVTVTDKTKLTNDIKKIMDITKPAYIRARGEDIANDSVYRQSWKSASSRASTKAEREAAKALLIEENRAAQSGGLDYTASFFHEPKGADIEERVRKMRFDMINKEHGKEADASPGDTRATTIGAGTNEDQEVDVTGRGW
jgi:hypothetical protein